MADTIAATMLELGRKSRKAAEILKASAASIRDCALLAAAAEITCAAETILGANAKDMASAKAGGISAAQLDRLKLDEERILAMVSGIKAVAALSDPVGKVSAEWGVPSGLHIKRVSVPLGVIGVIYESRPNVTADAAALCVKSGNACLLRPGTESFSSATAIAEAFRRGLAKGGLPEAAVAMVPSPDRALVGEMLRMREWIDVIIPRGGKSLISRVWEESRVPVLAHLDGNCHVYIDKAADPEKARRVAMNSKMRRTGICGAAETMLVDRAFPPADFAVLMRDLLDVGCEVRGCAATLSADPRVKPASESDWDTEYLDAVIAVKVVDGVDAAIRHIERHGSHHTDSIVTEDDAAAEKFLREVDSAIVMRNASTQFADGGEFGMGAEIGIATGRLHARGPVGLEQLNTFKYVVIGDGHIRK